MRIGVGLLSAVVGMLLASSAQPQSRPRLFSPWYTESLRDILDLEEDDVARLEQQLAANPDDFPARLKLMAYHQRADRVGRPEDRAKRAQHALWLVEHHPDSELLHSPVSRFSQDELSPEEYRLAVALWDTAAGAQPLSAAVQWNAASFFAGLDPALHMHYLEATAAADPSHPSGLGSLAYLYAQAIFDRGPLESHALAALDRSDNVWVLGNAAYMLQSLYNRSLQFGQENSRATELAERYFLRAKALDPNLDREKTLPEIDMEEIRRGWQAMEEAQRDSRTRFEEAIGEIRRLPVDAFPELPEAIAGVLRARSCTVPQPWTEGPGRNVVGGQFFAAGERGWAVLCSVDNRTELLAFRNDRDTNPETLSTSDDRDRLQGVGGDRIGYSRGITAVDRDFIMRNYRAFGGPEPPPIDHQGIDDAFIGKASVVLYFHQGQWLRLRGAD